LPQSNMDLDEKMAKERGFLAIRGKGNGTLERGALSLKQKRTNDNANISQKASTDGQGKGKKWSPKSAPIKKKKKKGISRAGTFHLNRIGEELGSEKSAEKTGRLASQECKREKAG